MAVNTTLLIGMFESAAQGMKAYEALGQAGFAPEQRGIALSENANASPNFERDLMDFGISQQRAHYYAGEYRAGNTLVSVRPDGKDREAQEILSRFGAYDENRRSNAGQTVRDSSIGTTDTTRRDANVTGTGRDTSRRDVVLNEADQEAVRTLKLRREQLLPVKQRVQTGEVSLHKEIVTEEKSINVPVSHEEVFIERRAVTGGATDTTPIGQDETISVPVSEERVRVEKNTVVTGEVSVGKREVTENQQISDTVRREEARVERQGDAPIQGTESDTSRQNQRNERRNERP